MNGRHSRHELFAGLGAEGQHRLADTRVAVVGCGALGSRHVELLTRAGVGTGEGWIRVIDRDYVEVSNLQRQALFDDDDARRARPKATAASLHAAKIDPAVRIQPYVRDFNTANALDLVRGAELILDATDNFRTRFLINDVAIQLGIPWIYGAAVGSRGAVATVVPGETPCLRCMLEEIPPLGATDTCDTEGVITPVPATVASIQVAALFRLVAARAYDRGILQFDLWRGAGSFQHVLASLKPAPGCRSCGTRELPALHGEAEEIARLCGRNSVQIDTGRAADLELAARRLSAASSLHQHEHSVTARFDAFSITLFDDGRVVVEGTTEVQEARALIDQYLGA